MNVPRTAAQQVPPAAMGVCGMLPPSYHTSGCRDWYSVHQTGGASPTNCRHPVSAPVSPHPTTVLLITRSAAYSHPAGHGWRPGHCDGSCPCGFSHCSLCLSHLPSHHGHCAGLCTHAFTPPDQVGSLLQALQCLPPLSLSHNLMAISSL